MLNTCAICASVAGPSTETPSIGRAPGGGISPRCTTIKGGVELGELMRIVVLGGALSAGPLAKISWEAPASPVGATVATLLVALLRASAPTRPKEKARLDTVANAREPSAACLRRLLDRCSVIVFSTFMLRFGLVVLVLVVVTALCVFGRLTIVIKLF